MICSVSSRTSAAADVINGVIRSLLRGEASANAAALCCSRWLSSAAETSLQVAETQYQPSKPKSIHIAKTSLELDPQHVGLYYKLNNNLIPEAFQQLHQAFYAPRDPGHERNGGCMELQREFETSKSHSIMFRQSMADLFSMASSDRFSKVLLRGPTGSGKSIALAALVEWARAQGWLVMYVPSALALTRGGFFTPRPGLSKQALQQYDTIISAQHILKAMLEVHEEQLRQMPQTATTMRGGVGAGGGGGTLLDLVTRGLSTDSDAQLAVDSCLMLREELIRASTSRPVLFAIDDYNALYWTTDYSAGTVRRRLLDVEQLTLASGLRLLAADGLDKAKVVAALTWSHGISRKLAVPLTACHDYYIKRFTPVEVGHALHHYHEQGLLPKPPTEQQVLQLLALTNGNGKELREAIHKVGLLSTAGFNH